MAHLPRQTAAAGLNIPARVTRTARRLHLRLARAYTHAAVFIAALERIRALPAFA